MTEHSASASEIQSIVRVSFFMRLVTLLIGLLGFVNQALTPVTAVATVLLALTSLAGLMIDRAPAILERHPILVLLDGVVMTVLMVVLGTDNPLVLVALSSCVIIGVVPEPPAAVLCTVVMISGYLAGVLPGDGRQFIATFGLPITFVSVVVLGQAFRIIADRKRQSERALADLVTGTATAQERARLARELHDSTAKTLQGLALTARSLDHWITRDPARATDQAREIADDADAAVVRLRQLLATLRQDKLDQPFHESLAAVARDVGQAHGVKVVLELDPVALSAPGVRYELLAAAREAITNAAVHSGAERVSVRLVARGDEVCVEIHDVGRGFSLDVLREREREGHFGVRGYSERLALIGGRAEVTSAPGRGTRVVLQAPLMGLVEVPA